MANKRKIYFRADASVEIGYGHFIRTLALADMLKDDFDCTFFTQAPTDYQRAEVGKVCKLEALPSDNSRFDLFLQKLNGTEIVVLDNYFFTTDYQRKIKAKGCKLVCIDDMHDKHYVADAIINHSLGVNISDYSVEPYTKLYLGLDYLLLRKPFLNVLQNNKIHKIKSFENLSVLLSFGGSDKKDLTSRYLLMLRDIDVVAKVYIVIGDAYSAKILDDLKFEYKRNLLAEEMASLLQSVDVAILPASTMMKEALACKTVVIGGYYVKNQVNSYKRFYDANAIIGVGDFVKQETLERVKTLLSSKSLPNNTLNHNIMPIMLSDNLKNIFKNLLTVDILNFNTEHFHFMSYTLLTENQSYEIWKGRNHPDIRKWMINITPFSFESHKAYVESLKHSDDKIHWAVFDKNNELVGAVALNPYSKEKKEGESGRFLLPQYIGLGLGKSISREFISFLFQNNFVNRIYAKTKVDNIRNQNLNLKLGFQIYNRDEEFVYMEIRNNK